MEKILISTNESKVNDTLSQCQHIALVANELNSQLKSDIDKSFKLTPELVKDVIKTGGKQIVQSYRDDQSKKLDKAGLSGKIKSNMLQTIDCDISDDLLGFQRKFTERGSYIIYGLDVIQYLSFTENGISVNEGVLKAINEMHSVYVETPEQLALYNSQQAAVKALNELREVTRKQLPHVFFRSSMEFYSSYFEYNVQDEAVSARAINYGLF